MIRRFLARKKKCERHDQNNEFSVFRDGWIKKNRDELER